MIKDIENNNESVKINDKEIAMLKEQFPSCFNMDGSFDIEKLAAQLKDKVDIVHEGYELKFLGKSYAKLLASIGTTTIIKPDAEHNNKPDNQNSGNIYISGDNLDALKHLLKSYSRQVKCIYIDPPYNTGSDGFVYQDKFSFTSDELQQKLSVDETQAQRILDLTKRNSASHSAWLLFMHPRLQLARELLTNDGVIFISIDDNEQANLKLLCDDIFGEENFVAAFPWRKRTAKSDVPFGISQDYEWIICYAKQDFISCLEGGSRKYFETPDLPNRPWRVHDLTTQKSASERPNSFFTIVNPKTGHEYPANPIRTWAMTEDTFQKYYAENRVVFPGDYDFLSISKPAFRYFKEDDEAKSGEMFGFVPVSTNLPKEVGMSQNGTKDFEELFNSKIFSFPKPVALIKYLVKAATNFNKKSIVLDFFSGSATTAQAVMELNNEDKGERKFVVVQLPEELKADNPQQKAACDFLTSINRPHTLDQIGIERIIRAAKKIKEETGADIDYGFKHYELCEANQNTLDKCETFDKSALIADTSLLDDFGLESVLATWLINDGYGFGATLQTIDLLGYTAYYCKKHLYLVNPYLTQESVANLFEKYNSIPGFNPENIVMFGYSFNEWSVTEMLEKNLKVLNDLEKNLKINIDVRY